MIRDSLQDLPFLIADVKKRTGVWRGMMKWKRKYNFGQWLFVI